MKAKKSFAHRDWDFFLLFALLLVIYSSYSLASLAINRKQANLDRAPVVTATKIKKIKSLGADRQLDSEIGSELQIVGKFVPATYLRTDSNAGTIDLYTAFKPKDGEKIFLLKFGALQSLEVALALSENLTQRLKEETLTVQINKMDDLQKENVKILTQNAAENLVLSETVFLERKRLPEDVQTWSSTVSHSIINREFLLYLVALLVSVVLTYLRLSGRGKVERLQPVRAAASK